METLTTDGCLFFFIVSVVMYKQDADLSNLMANIRVLQNQTEQLTANNRVLKNQTEELSRDRDDLNQTLGVIMTFDNFPVKDLCPDKSEY